MSSSYKAAPLMLLSRWVFKLWLRWGHKESEFVLHCFLTDNKGGCLRFWKEVWPLFKSNHRYLYNNYLRSLHPGIFKTLMSLELLWVVMFFFLFFFCKLWKSIVKICHSDFYSKKEWPNLCKCIIRVLSLLIFTDLTVKFIRKHWVSGIK